MGGWENGLFGRMVMGEWAWPGEWVVGRMGGEDGWENGWDEVPLPLPIASPVASPQIWRPASLLSQRCYEAPICQMDCSMSLVAPIHRPLWWAMLDPGALLTKPLMAR